MAGFFSPIWRAGCSVRWRNRVLCVLFFACVLFSSGWGLVILAAGTGARGGSDGKAAAPPTQAEVDALKTEMEGVKANADALKEREEDLKWILGFILGAAALFAFAQGVSTWFSAESFNKQAEESLKSAKNSEKSAGELLSNIKEKATQASQDIEARASELQEKYPLFSGEEARRRDAFDDLRRIFPDEAFNWQRDDYEKMPLFDRQRLLSIERFISYEVAGSQDVDEVYVRRLRGLARFYWSKFIYERRHGSGNYADLDHAEYLADLAMRRIGAAFYLLNDLGNIHIERYRAFASAISAKRHTREYQAQLKSILADAKKRFLESIEAQSGQLRAYFNLAFVEIRLCECEEAKELGLRKAIEDLRNGLKLSPGAKYPNWEHEPVKEYYGSALYNLACYHARLAQLHADKTVRSAAEARACQAVLRKAARIGMATPEDVTADFDKKSGDFYPLLQSATPEVNRRFQELRTELLENSRRK